MSDYASMAAALPHLTPYWFMRIEERVQAGQSCFVLLNCTTKQPYVIGDDLPGELANCLSIGDQILAYASARSVELVNYPWHQQVGRA